MLILKRLAMWSGEMLCEALLITLFLTVLWKGKGQSILRDDIGVIFMGTAFVFMVGSGYLLTTGFFGVVWRSPIPWAYPAIAATLFSGHVQFFATGWDAWTKVPVQVGGACIVFACTLAGNYFLRKWVQAVSKQQGLGPG